jgi:Ran GTPase-activating protein (RanGAP) involved in mRNA processing and transport
MDAAITALEENVAEEVVVDGPMVLNGLTKFCAALKKNTAVRRLSLRDTKTKGATMIALSNAIAGCTSLEELDLSRNAIQPSGIKTLLSALISAQGTLPAGAGVRRLRLEDNSLLDDSCGAVLALLGGAHSLTAVSLRGCNIGDHALSAACGALPGDAPLQELDLRSAPRAPPPAPPPARPAPRAPPRAPRPARPATG